MEAGARATHGAVAEAQIAGNSWTIAKICNEELEDFSHRQTIHELIRGSLYQEKLKIEKSYTDLTKSVYIQKYYIFYLR